MLVGRKITILLSLTVLTLFHFADNEVQSFGIMKDSSAGGSEEEDANATGATNDVNLNGNDSASGAVRESANDDVDSGKVETDDEGKSEEVSGEETADATVPTSTADADADAEQEPLVSEESKTENAAAAAAAAAASQSETQQSATETQEKQKEEKEKEQVAQKGPFVDLFGETLLSLEMVDETHAKLNTHNTNDALANKKVIGLYFSADWCGPCRQFTPELVSFYDRMNSRKGQNGSFEIVWISRCRDVKSFGQYFTHMKWLALPPEESLGARGQKLSEQFKVNGIPHLVLLDEFGSVITYDARNKIPQDKAGIGFPWRNPLVTLYVTFVPKSLRFLVKSHVDGVKDKVANVVQKVSKKPQTA